MSVTKKDLEVIASSIGQSLYLNNIEKWEDLSDDGREILTYLSYAFAELNAQFDEQRFLEWIEDVATRRRDVNGRKVK